MKPFVSHTLPHGFAKEEKENSSVTVAMKPMSLLQNQEGDTKKSARLHWNFHQGRLNTI
jgi:hypothetical protein